MKVKATTDWTGEVDFYISIPDQSAEGYSLNGTLYTTHKLYSLKHTDIPVYVSGTIVVSGEFRVTVTELRILIGSDIKMVKDLGQGVLMDEDCGVADDCEIKSLSLENFRIVRSDRRPEMEKNLIGNPEGMQSEDSGGEQSQATTSQNYSRPNPAANPSSSEYLSRNRNDNAERQAEFQREYQEHQQKYLQEAQKSYKKTIDMIGKFAEQKRARKARKEAYWAEQRRKDKISRANGRQRKQAFLREYSNISAATDEYIRWLRDEIKATPQIYYMENIISEGKLVTGDAFYFSVLELYQRELSDNEKKRDYVNPGKLNEVYGKSYDTRIEISSPILLRANSATEYYTKLAQQRIYNELGSEGSTIFLIASKGNEALLQFLSYIEPVDNNPYIFKRNPKDVSGKLYSIKQTYPTSYKRLIMANPTVDDYWEMGKDNYSVYLIIKDNIIYDHDRRQVAYNKSDAYFLIGLAADLGNEEAIAWKEEQRKKSTAIADFKEKYNSNVFFLIKDNKLDMLKNLVELNELKLNELYPVFLDGEKRNLGLLHISAIYQNKEMIKYLVDAGAPIEQKTSLGTPLLVAIQQGSLPAVYELLELGANPHVAVNGYSSLMLAVSYFRKGDAQHKKAGEWLIATLVKFDANINIFSPNGRWSALHWAARNGLDDAARALIKRGANINLKNLEAGQTPLHVTAHYNTTGVAKVLLEAGCDTSIEDKWGQKAIVIARREGSQEVRKLIKSYTN